MTSDAPRLLFVGDSITDAGRTRHDEGLGEGYVRLIAQSREAANATVLNRGVGGDRAVDLLERWERDCENLDPDVVTIHVGINDVWRRFSAGDPTPVEQFEATYRRLLERTRHGTSARIVLMTPFVVPVDPGQSEWHVDLDPKKAVVRRLAAEFQTSFVALDDAISNGLSQLPPRALAEDGVHPTPHGHRIIADAWLDAVLRAA